MCAIVDEQTVRLVFISVTAMTLLSAGGALGMAIYLVKSSNTAAKATAEAARVIAANMEKLEALLNEARSEAGKNGRRLSAARRNEES